MDTIERTVTVTMTAEEWDVIQIALILKASESDDMGHKAYSAELSNLRRVIMAQLPKTET